MSLLTDIQTFVNNVGNVHPDDVLNSLNYNGNILGIGTATPASIVDDLWLEDRRWSTVRMAVINRGDENVAYVYNEPSTEMQDWDDWSASDTEVYEVIGEEVAKVTYVRP